MTASIDQTQFRRAMGNFATGVTVISSRDGDLRPYGMTASSFGSLSLDPPLVQWSVRTASIGYPIFAAAEMFAVNILAAEQEDVSRNFCMPIDRFATVNWEEGYDGLPLIHGCLGWVECARERTIAAGDHHIFIGRVLRARMFDRAPLLHWQGDYLPVPKVVRTRAACGESSSAQLIHRPESCRARSACTVQRRSGRRARGSADAGTSQP